MTNKPFIIKSKVVEPMLPKDSEHYDEAQQTRIQILQAINGYLAINMLYESFKLMWSFWHYQSQCYSFAYLSLGFLIVNVIWALISYWGFKAIRSKNSRYFYHSQRNIKIFGYVVIFNFFLRIVMYIICGAVMHGYVPNYMNITEQQLHSNVFLDKLDIICTALYPQALYIIQGIFEAVISLFVLFLCKSVYFYVKTWENSETLKYNPVKLNQMADY